MGMETGIGNQTPKGRQKKLLFFVMSKNFHYMALRIQLSALNTVSHVGETSCSGVAYRGWGKKHRIACWSDIVCMVNDDQPVLIFFQFVQVVYREGEERYAPFRAESHPTLRVVSAPIFVSSPPHVNSRARAPLSLNKCARRAPLHPPSLLARSSAPSQTARVAPRSRPW